MEVETVFGFIITVAQRHKVGFVIESKSNSDIVGGF